MNSFVVVFVAALACASASIIAAPVSRIIQGPSSSATIVGPDGSAISSIAPGGTIVADAAPGLVAASAPLVAAAPTLLRSSIVAAPSAWAAPALLARSSILAPGALAAPAILARSSLIAPSVLAAQRTTIAGPSGVIDTTGPLAAAPLTAALW